MREPVVVGAVLVGVFLCLPSSNDAQLFKLPRLSGRLRLPKIFRRPSSQPSETDITGLLPPGTDPGSPALQKLLLKQYTEPASSNVPPANPGGPGLANPPMQLPGFNFGNKQPGFPQFSPFGTPNQMPPPPSNNMPPPVPLPNQLGMPNGPIPMPQNQQNQFGFGNIPPMPSTAQGLTIPPPFPPPFGVPNGPPHGLQLPPPPNMKRHPPHPYQLLESSDGEDDRDSYMDEEPPIIIRGRRPSKSRRPRPIVIDDPPVVFRQVKRPYDDRDVSSSEEEPPIIIRQRRPSRHRRPYDEDNDYYDTRKRPSVAFLDDPPMVFRDKRPYRGRPFKEPTFEDEISSEKHTSAYMDEESVVMPARRFPHLKPTVYRISSDRKRPSVPVYPKRPGSSMNSEQSMMIPTTHPPLSFPSFFPGKGLNSIFNSHLSNDEISSILNGQGPGGLSPFSLLPKPIFINAPKVILPPHLDQPPPVRDHILFPPKQFSSADKIVLSARPDHPPEDFPMLVHVPKKSTHLPEKETNRPRYVPAIIVPVGSVSTQKVKSFDRPSSEEKSKVLLFRPVNLENVKVLKLQSAATRAQGKPVLYISDAHESEGKGKDSVLNLKYSSGKQMSQLFPPTPLSTHDNSESSPQSSSVFFHNTGFPSSSYSQQNSHKPGPHSIFEIDSNDIQSYSSSSSSSNSNTPPAIRIVVRNSGKGSHGGSNLRPQMSVFTPNDRDHSSSLTSPEVQSGFRPSQPISSSQTTNNGSPRKIVIITLPQSSVSSDTNSRSGGSVTTYYQQSTGPNKESSQFMSPPPSPKYDYIPPPPAHVHPTSKPILPAPQPAPAYQTQQSTYYHPPASPYTPPPTPANSFSRIPSVPAYAQRTTPAPAYTTRSPPPPPPPSPPRYNRIPAQVSSPQPTKTVARTTVYSSLGQSSAAPSPAPSAFKPRREEPYPAANQQVFRGPVPAPVVDAYSSIPGEAGRDYPTLSVIPDVNFNCYNKAPGFYANVQYKCQVYHLCSSQGALQTFLCPNGTVFNQESFVCEWWYNVDCASSEQHFGKNNNLYKPTESPATSYQQPHGQNDNYQSSGYKSPSYHSQAKQSQFSSNSRPTTYQSSSSNPPRNYSPAPSSYQNVPSATSYQSSASSPAQTHHSHTYRHTTHHNPDYNYQASNPEPTIVKPNSNSTSPEARPQSPGTRRRTIMKTRKSVKTTISESSPSSHS